MSNDPLRSVMVGVDGSPESLDALEWAARYAERFEQELVLLVAWHVPTPHISTGGLHDVDLEAAASAIAKDAAETVLSRHPKVTFTQTVASGAPGKVLVEGSKEAGLLVIGTRRALGTVSSYCAHYAACPVVIVRPENGGLQDHG